MFIGVCPTLQGPIHGKVFVQENIAVFVCFGGAVIGQPVLRCVNGTWNYPPPSCKLLNF